MSLADSGEFKRMVGELPRHSGGTRPAMISFEQPAEAMRLFYAQAGSEDGREQLRRQARRNPLLKSLNAAMDENPLPPFALVEQYLAPRGATIANDESGLHHTTFSLRPKPD